MSILAGTGVNHPFYRAFFVCWNEQRYYEAHDVLEQVWLNTNSDDDDFFKGLIQAAGAFVHLQKISNTQHTKHGRRLRPAVKLFELAEKTCRASRRDIMRSMFRCCSIFAKHAPENHRLRF